VLMMISHANGSGQRLCSSIWSSRSQMVQTSLMVQCFRLQISPAERVAVSEPCGITWTNSSV
jgi:hypothetical protein